MAPFAGAMSEVIKVFPGGRGRHCMRATPEARTPSAASAPAPSKAPDAMLVLATAIGAPGLTCSSVNWPIASASSALASFAKLWLAALVSSTMAAFCCVPLVHAVDAVLIS